MASFEVREPTFFILTALVGGKKHGYALIQETAELSDGRLTLKVGTLYAALDRLQSDGLVSSAGDEIVDGRHRRYWNLTEAGEDLLESEVRRLEANAGRAKARLALRPGHATRAAIA